MAWLGAVRDQEDVLDRVTKGGDESHWALQNQFISAWLSNDKNKSMIWLNGKPGLGKSLDQHFAIAFYPSKQGHECISNFIQGKTYLCGKMIENMRTAGKNKTIFYFCQHDGASLDPVTEMLRNFASQLLALDTSLSPYILDEFANNGLRPSKKHLVVVLEKMLLPFGSIHIVVDGLDEWTSVEQETVVTNLINMKKACQGSCSILVSSRVTSSITKLLQQHPTVCLDQFPEMAQIAIASHVHKFLDSHGQRFSTQTINRLEEEILSKARGIMTRYLM